MVLQQYRFISDTHISQLQPSEEKSIEVIRNLQFKTIIGIWYLYTYNFILWPLQQKTMTWVITIDTWLLWWGVTSQELWWLTHHHRNYDDKYYRILTHHQCNSPKHVCGCPQRKRRAIQTIQDPRSKMTFLIKPWRVFDSDEVVKSAKQQWGVRAKQQKGACQGSGTHCGRPFINDLVVREICAIRSWPRTMILVNINADGFSCNPLSRKKGD